MVLVLFACYLVVGLAPLGIAHGEIERRAKAARLLPYRYYVVTTVGSLAGLFGTPAAIGLLLAREKWFQDLWPLGGFALVSLFGWIAAGVGAWAGVAYLRLTTATDRDYGEGPAGAGSLEADVPEARDRDHVRPD